MREPALVYLSDCVLTKCEVKYRHKVDAAWRLFEHAYRSEYLFEIIANSCISFIIEILEKRQLNERSRFRRDMERKRNTILAWFAEIEEEWRREKANARERLRLDEDPVLFQNPRIGNTEAIAQQPFRTEDPSYSDEELDEYPDVEEDGVYDDDDIMEADQAQAAEMMLQQCDDDEMEDDEEESVERRMESKVDRGLVKILMMKKILARRSKRKKSFRSLCLSFIPFTIPLLSVGVWCRTT